MPDFASNDPREFGWSLDFRGFVPFVDHGLSFPQGVHPLVAQVFAAALSRLRADGLGWPAANVGLGAGCWGQENRTIAGSSTQSFHSFGLAIDVFAPHNPAGVSNPSPSPYRLPDNTSALVEPLGVLWGGSPRFGDHPDRMHLEIHLSPAELSAVRGVPPARGSQEHPFPLPESYYYGPLAGPARSISGNFRTDGPYRAGLALAQARLGVTADGYFGPLTMLAARVWQERHALVADGLIGRRTWDSLFPV